VCGGGTTPLDVVDFNKSCEELRGRYLPLAEVPIYYVLCRQCGFCFAPELHAWKLEEFESRIYNDAYIDVDPDYTGVRPEANARSLAEMFGNRVAGIRHLDYGGGHGLLSDLMRDSGWESSSYDPFVDGDLNPDAWGKFGLITAYEVFEHVPNVKQLASDLVTLLDENGIVLFTTLVSDGHIQEHQRITWWYASPRNGHISLFSRKSLQILGTNAGFRFGSFSEGFHAFWRTIPPWARHLIQDA
jgi:SAM-dependent methyltransferase